MVLQASTSTSSCSSHIQDAWVLSTGPGSRYHGVRETARAREALTRHDGKEGCLREIKEHWLTWGALATHRRLIKLYISYFRIVDPDTGGNYL